MADTKPLHLPQSKGLDTIKLNRCTNLSDLMRAKIEQLDSKDRRWFHNLRPLNIVNVVAAICVNASARKSMMVYEAFISGSIAISGVTCIFSNMGQFGLLQVPLLTGKLHCESCAVVRGGVIQAVGGFLLPAVFSFAMNSIIAERYKSAEVPHLSFPVEQRFKDFWRAKLSYTRKYTGGVLLAQVLIGAYFAHKQFRIAQQTKESVTEEEYKSLWNHTATQIKFF